MQTAVRRGTPPALAVVPIIPAPREVQAPWPALGPASAAIMKLLVGNSALLARAVRLAARSAVCCHAAVLRVLLPESPQLLTLVLALKLLFALSTAAAATSLSCCHLAAWRRCIPRVMIAICPVGGRKEHPRHERAGEHTEAEG